MIIDVSSSSGTREIVLDKKGMEVKIIGIFQVEKKEKRELHLIIRHTAPNTKAETLLKGVVKDTAHLLLKGTIVVEKNATQTNSFLREQVLLISPYATAETIPNLEIKTDDVKCSHAATISNIDEEQVFYLMSRGMSKRKAEAMIVKGFLMPEQTQHTRMF